MTILQSSNQLTTQFKDELNNMLNNKRCCCVEVSSGFIIFLLYVYVLLLIPDIPIGFEQLYVFRIDFT